MTVENICDPSSQKNVTRPGWDQTWNPLITSRMCIQLSHRGQLQKNKKNIYVDIYGAKTWFLPDTGF